MKQSQFLISLLFGFSLFVLFGANAASAQGGSFAVKLTPEFPAPATSVTAQVVSSSFNVDAASITWLLNGKIQLQGVGKRNFTFATGEAGSNILLRAEINTDDFGVVSKDIEITPSDVDVLWETDTYTPPFYKGKALPTSQSHIKAVALPNFITKKGRIASKNLIYQWKKTYTPNPNDSGLGKDIYFYRGTYTFNEDVIDTTVSTPDNQLSISKKTKIAVYEPKIIFYERKPLEGVRYENFLSGNFNIKEQEVTLRAEPYFFSFSNADDNGAVFTWQLDGKKQETNPDKKSEFTLRKPEKGSGHAGVTIKVENLGYSLQSTSKNITLLYSN